MEKSQLGLTGGISWEEEVLLTKVSSVVSPGSWAEVEVRCQKEEDASGDEEDGEEG